MLRTRPRRANIDVLRAGIFLSRVIGASSLVVWSPQSLHKDGLLGDETGSEEEEEERGQQRGLRECRGRRGHHRVG